MLRIRIALVAAVIAAASAVVPLVHAQFIQGQGVTAGVAVTPEGLLQYKQVGSVNAPATRPSNGLVYVSLPRALDQWKAAKDAGKDAPAEVRFLQGLTQIQNIFLYPAEKDIVLAGPSEPYKTDNPLMPLGTVSGRPVLQLEDLIVAVRAVMNRGAVNRHGGGDFYGVTMEQPANFQEVWQPTLNKFGRGPRPQLVAEMKKALGPQQVQFSGVPGNSRLALGMLVADYRLKRLCMGIETLPNLGNALNAEVSAPRFWFEPAYESLRVSPDGLRYEIRGARLRVLAGDSPTDEKGATDHHRALAKNISTRMQELAGKNSAVADLQNIADAFLLAVLIRDDRLAEKSGIDLQWLTADSGRYQTATLTEPRTAETVVHINGNAIAQGGVALRARAFAGIERNTDDKTPMTLEAQRPAQNWFLTAKTK